MEYPKKLKTPAGGSTGMDKKIADLVFELLHSSTKTHIAHLVTTSYAAHKAMNSFYDDVIDLADDVAEQYQGAVEKILSYPESMELPPLKTTEQVISYLRTLHSRITDIQKECSYSEISNTLDEVKSLINSTKYKLLFLK